MSRVQLLKDIRYLSDLVEGYLVNEGWLVNDGYMGIIKGELDLNEFLVEAIKDIFSEVEQNTYGSISDEEMKVFFTDKRVYRIAKRYNIDYEYKGKE